MKKENLVISPVYNEEKTLEEFHARLMRCYSQDVLFVDDGSSDKSGDFLSGIKDEKTFLITHRRRSGYGAALTSGFEFSLKEKYQRIVVIDVDLQHSPEHIPAFLRELFEVDVALGSRYIRIGSSLDVPRERLIINRYVTGLINLLFSASFTDPFCGYRAYRDSFLRKAHFTEKSYGLGIEIILELIRTKAPFKEIPVEAVYFDPSRVFLDGLNNPKERLFYYLEIIARKNKEMLSGQKVFSGKPSSR